MKKSEFHKYLTEVIKEEILSASKINDNKKKEYAKSAIRDVFLQMYSRTIPLNLWPAYFNQIASNFGKDETTMAFDELINNKWIQNDGKKLIWRKAFGPVNYNIISNKPVSPEKHCMFVISVRESVRKQLKEMPYGHYQGHYLDLNIEDYPVSNSTKKTFIDAFNKGELCAYDNKSECWYLIASTSIKKIDKPTTIVLPEYWIQYVETDMMTGKSDRPAKSPFVDTQRMYETISKVGNKYCVFAKKNHRKLGTFNTKKDALKQLRAIEINKGK